ncbi:MAG: hypothetical protein ABJN21_13670 [Paracoccaceae bacterium]
MAINYQFECIQGKRLADGGTDVIANEEASSANTLSKPTHLL